MAKYYTPTKDEFHKGFECEIYTENDSYEKFLCDIDYNTPIYRVKYLDTDDIKDLGFTIKHEVPNEYIVFHKNVISQQPLYYALIFREENGLPFIELTDMYNHPLMAKVHIKNKNELSWLLNRYGIL